MASTPTNSGPSALHQVPIHDAPEQTVLAADPVRTLENIRTNLTYRHFGLTATAPRRLNMLTQELWSELTALPFDPTVEPAYQRWIRLYSVQIPAPDDMLRRTDMNILRAQREDSRLGFGDSGVSHLATTISTLTPPPVAGDGVLAGSSSTSFPPARIIFSESGVRTPANPSASSSASSSASVTQELPTPVDFSILNGSTVHNLNVRGEVLYFARVTEIFTNGASKPKKIEFKRTQGGKPIIWTMVMKEQDVFIDWIYMEMACKFNRIWASYHRKTKQARMMQIGPSNLLPSRNLECFQYCDEVFSLQTWLDPRCIEYMPAIACPSACPVGDALEEDRIIRSDVYSVMPLSRYGGLLEFAHNCKTADKIGNKIPLLINGLLYWAPTSTLAPTRIIQDTLDYFIPSRVDRREPHPRSKLPHWMYNAATNQLKATNLLLLSSVAAFVTAYVLNVNDMHQDNILYSGKLLLIDFGFIGGEAPFPSTPAFPLPYALRLCFHSQPHMWHTFKELVYRAIAVLKEDQEQEEEEDGYGVNLDQLMKFDAKTPTDNDTVDENELMPHEIRLHRIKEALRDHCRKPPALISDPWQHELEEAIIRDEFVHLRKCLIQLTKGQESSAQLLRSLVQPLKERLNASQEELDVMIEWGSFRTIPKMISRMVVKNWYYTSELISAFPMSIAAGSFSLATVCWRYRSHIIAELPSMATATRLAPYAFRFSVCSLGTYLVYWGLSHLEQKSAKWLAAPISKRYGSPPQPGQPGALKYALALSWVDWIRRSLPLGAAWLVGWTNPLKWSPVAKLALGMLTFNIIVSDMLMIKKDKENRARCNVIAKLKQDGFSPPGYPLPLDHSYQDPSTSIWRRCIRSMVLPSQYVLLIALGYANRHRAQTCFSYVVSWLKVLWG